jgi:hypothetical protein
MLLECKKFPEHRKAEVDVIRSLYRVEKKIKISPVLLSTTSDFATGATATKASYYILQQQEHNTLVDWIQEFHT